MFGCFDYIDSPIGILTIISSSKGITNVHFGRKEFSNRIDEKTIARELVIQCKIQLEEYFSNRRTTFTIPFEITGTLFQQKVWNALQEIPFGETRSYKEIARIIENEKACRAIGMANNRNPLPILIPCHRVVGVSGKMVGYAGDIWRKEWLLKHELAIV
jgi:methylated-DNA-[protein]-cysteine S-methyltransferase